MQKFVTIYLTDDDENDQQQTEHLEDYLADGWHIVSITPMGGAVGVEGEEHCKPYYVVAGWFGVLMVK